MPLQPLSRAGATATRISPHDTTRLWLKKVVT